MIIDTHMHCWQLSRGDYGWLTPSLSPLYRDYLPPDIIPTLTAEGVNGVVLIQAAPTMSETQYLLSLADQYAFILGVVGWVDFEHPEVEHHLHSLAQHPKLKGFRPMIQDIADINWMLGRKVNNTLSLLEKHNLVFDALVKPVHLTNLLTVQQQHPELTTVIDHAAKPDLKIHNISQWKKDIKKLAEDTQVMCKVSGLLTEAKKDATLEDLKPCLDWLFEHFGPSRLMFGSDWPVINLCSHYTQWINMLREYTDNLSKSDKQMFWANNAQAVYQLE